MNTEDEKEKNVKVIKIEYLLKEIKKSMEDKTPFSLIRFGDGGIKVIHALASGDFSQLSDISKKEGIPIEEINVVVKLWAVAASNANYIDTPQVYFSSSFWPRIRKHKPMTQRTVRRLKLWDHLYRIAGFDTDRFCNPESNFLMCLSRYKELCLPDLLRGKRVCCITAVEDLNKYTKPFGLSLNILHIAGHEKDQYKCSFENVIKTIDTTATDYDMWLVAAGELGRIYPYLIKNKGGRAIDVGSLVDFWKTGDVPIRLVYFMKKDPSNNLKLLLTSRGKDYEGKF